METKTTKIGLACMLGGFIGALVSLEIARTFAIGEYFWIIGALIGGGISYLAYDLQEIKAGMSRAWQKTISWKPDKKWWKLYLKTLLAIPIALGIVSFTIIVFPFVALYYAGRGLLWLIQKIPAGIAVFRKFVKETFIYIHSEERVLCLVDGSLGATIGFFMGSAIMGGVAGLIFGVINYELISKRALGLVKNG